jgi:Mycobacterium membrane protein
MEKTPDAFSRLRGLLVPLVALASSATGVWGRDKEMMFAGAPTRVWIPLAVTGCGGFAVSRVRSGFGTQAPTAHSSATEPGTVSTSKSLLYEVFGPVGTVADISYFDVYSDPRRVEGARLPCSLQITATASAVLGNVVAQGDSDSIGCRIVVNGQVRVERISNEVNAFTHCLVKGA